MLRDLSLYTGHLLPRVMEPGKSGKESQNNLEVTGLAILSKARQTLKEAPV